MVWIQKIWGTVPQKLTGPHFVRQGKVNFTSFFIQSFLNLKIIKSSKGFETIQPLNLQTYQASVISMLDRSWHSFLDVKKDGALEAAVYFFLTLKSNYDQLINRQSYFTLEIHYQLLMCPRLTSCRENYQGGLWTASKCECVSSVWSRSVVEKKRLFSADKKKKRKVS